MTLLTRRLPAVLAALVLAFAAVAPTTPAAAGIPGGGSAQSSVGGPALSGRGVIVRLPRGVPAPPAVSAASYVVADLDTGAVLAAKDAHGRYAPASTLKTLTAITLIPHLAASRVVTATAADVNVDGSKVGIVPGMRYRVDQLFLAMMMVSGNDAANALAGAAGGVPATLAAMNAQARLLGAGDTVARTPSGLDAPGQVTSAYDLALITRAGLQLPDFRRYVASRQAEFPAPGGRQFQIFTHNRLLVRYRGAIGVKNGYTSTARASFVGAARRGDRTLVVTLLRAEPRVWDEAARLLDWGFALGARTHPVGTLVDPAAGPRTDRRVPAEGAAPRAASHTAAVPLPPADRSPLALFGMAALVACALVGLRVRAREGEPARAGHHRRTPLPPI